MRVVLYLRFSSAKQNEQSIEGQDRVCTEFCAREGHEIIARYIDRAASASKDIEKREAFLKMISDSANQDFDAVVVYKLDRFSRNRYDSAIYRAKLKKNGVRLLSATENLTDSPESIILEAMLEGMAEYYSLELSQKVKRGMHESALKASSNGGSIAYGYKTVDKKYVIDELTAPIVREIFRRVADGEPQFMIAKSLNERGLRTKHGARWNKNSFRTMLQNPRYIGTYAFDGMEIPDAIPAIVDKDTFERVQTIIQAQKKPYVPSRQSTGDFWLTGRLFCGHCGEGMIGESGTDKKGQTHYYYVCRKVKSRRGCDKKRVRKEAVENAIYEDVLSCFGEYEMTELAEGAVEASRSAFDLEAIKDIEEQLKSLQKKISSVIDMVEITGPTKDLAERLKELTEQRDQMEEDLESRKAQIGPVLTKEEVLAWLQSVKDRSYNNEDFKRQLVCLMVNAVYIYDNPDGQHIKILYNTMNQHDIPLTLKEVNSLPPANSSGWVISPPSSIYSNRALLIRERRV